MKPLKIEVSSEGAPGVMRWVHFPDHGVTLADLLVPSYWSHVSPVFARVNGVSIIEVFAEDNSWSAELVVMQTGARTDRGAVVAVRGHWKHETARETELQPVDDVFEVSFVPHQRWRVVRKADHAVMAKDLPSRAEAEAAMRVMPRPAVAA